MRKYISLILLVLILFVSNGYQLYFRYLQHEIHQELKYKIRRGINEKDLSIIIVSSSNDPKIQWTKKGKEFQYKGLMYDVVKKEIKEGKTYYYCLNDVKEQRLIANYSRHNQRRNKVLLKIRKVLSNKYLPEFLAVNQKTDSDKIRFTAYQELYNSIYLSPQSPPPQV